MTGFKNMPGNAQGRHHRERGSIGRTWSTHTWSINYITNNNCREHGKGLPREATMWQQHHSTCLRKLTTCHSQWKHKVAKPTLWETLQRTDKPPRADAHRATTPKFACTTTRLGQAHAYAYRSLHAPHIASPTRTRASPNRLTAIRDTAEKYTIKMGLSTAYMMEPLGGPDQECPL